MKHKKKRNSEDQIECEIAKQLYQIQVNVPTNFQSERVQEKGAWEEVGASWDCGFAGDEN